MSNRDIGMPLISVYIASWWFAMFSILVFVTSNGAPLAPELGWKEAEATTNQKITIELTREARDPNGDKITYVYDWRRNGEVVTAVNGGLEMPMRGKSVSGKNTVKGDVFEVTVTPDDGTMGDGALCSLPWRQCAGPGGAATASITIGNAPPRARVNFVDAEGVDVEDKDAIDHRSDVFLDLSCYDPDVNDAARAAREAGEEPVELPEGEEPADPCTYTIEWFKGADPIEDDEEREPDHTGENLGYRLTTADDTWRVRVTANDGEDDGEPRIESLKVVK